MIPLRPTATFLRKRAIPSIQSAITLAETITEPSRIVFLIKEPSNIIDDYCERYYKDNIPKELVALKDMLTKFVLDPNFPQNQEKELEPFSFGDDNITVHFMFNELTFYVDNEEELTKFPQGEIKIIDISDPDEEYYFFITNNKDREINITLKNADSDKSDDDELDFIDDEDFEDED